MVLIQCLNQSSQVLIETFPGVGGKLLDQLEIKQTESQLELKLTWCWAWQKQEHQQYLKLNIGLALNHHGHPAARLRVERLYGVPVLLSGLSALVLFKQEQNILYECHKNSLSKLMKMHDRTPDSVVFFLAGSLPITALLHLRRLSLFNMICNQVSQQARSKLEVSK